MSFCCDIVSLRFATSHATSSKFVPLPSPPPVNSKLGVFLVPVKVVMSFLRLLSALVTRLNSEGGGVLCCGVGHVACWEPVGDPMGSPMAGSAISLFACFELVGIIVDRAQRSSERLDTRGSGVNVESIVTEDELAQIGRAHV